MFGPPVPKPKPPVCTGVLGDTAIINGKAYKVGQDAGGAKIVSIAPTEVMVLWQDKEIRLPAFGAGKIAPSTPQPVQKRSKKKLKAKPVKKTAVASNSKADPEGMQIDLRNMSREEREAYRRARKARGEGGGRRRPRDREGPRDRQRPRE